MKNRNICTAVILTMVFLTASAGYAALNTHSAVTAIADRLVNMQLTQGLDAGSWRAEQEFTGSIVAGLASAYQMTGKEEYKTAAEAGGDWILRSALTVDMYGDEAFALMKLSEISCDPQNNRWRTALVDFFQCVHVQPAYPPANVPGTAGYIQAFAYGTDVTTAVFYISNFTVAAYYVNAPDKDVWRAYLINYLAYTNDDAEGNLMPILAFGSAVWALAETGALDNTPVQPYPSGYPATIWIGKKLKDLPAFLKSQRSPDSMYPSGGNFYWRFDHQWGCGYTEDDIFGLMGLRSSQKRVATLNYDSDVQAVRGHLLDAIDNSGAVYAHVDWDIVFCYKYHHMAGELLTALQAAAIRGDIDLNDRVDFADLAYFSSRWLNSGGPCVGSDNIVDLDQDGTINFTDFAIIAGHMGSHF